MAPLVAQDQPLTLEDYSYSSGQTDRLPQHEDNIEMFLYGIYGEIGSFLSAIKKIKRDAISDKHATMTGEELGDALWYLFALARQFKVDPNRLGRESLCILAGTELQKVTFRVLNGCIQSNPEKFGIADRPTVVRELIAAVNNIMHFAHSTHENEVVAGLAKALSLLSIVSSSLGLSIEDVAVENLKKNSSRWPANDKKQYAPLFDLAFSPEEQFPKELELHFKERNVGGKDYCFITMRGVNIGDRLTDNNHDKDDYKFHDVFHLAYLTHLGWSPVLRALLKLKRKSVPKIDENEDGARAIIIEEGISTWIFNHARNAENGYYENVKPGQLEYSILKQVANLVKGYEVEECPLWQWEMAILDGFKMYRELVAHRSGIIKVDLALRTIEFSKIQ